MKKRLNITTTITHSDGTRDYAFEHRSVNWTTKEARRNVMAMATAYAPSSKKYVYQAFSDNELAEYPYKNYQYSVVVRDGKIEKEFEFEINFK